MYAMHIYFSIRAAKLRRKPAGLHGRGSSWRYDHISRFSVCAVYVIPRWRTTAGRRIQECWYIQKILCHHAGLGRNRPSSSPKVRGCWWREAAAASWYLKGVLRRDLVIFRSRPGYRIQADWILERRFLPAETLPSQGKCNMIHPYITNIHQSSSIQLACYDLVGLARLFLVIIPITQ